MTRSNAQVVARSLAGPGRLTAAQANAQTLANIYQYLEEQHGADWRAKVDGPREVNENTAPAPALVAAH